MVLHWYEHSFKHNLKSESDQYEVSFFLEIFMRMSGSQQIYPRHHTLSVFIISIILEN